MRACCVRAVIGACFFIVPSLSAGLVGAQTADTDAAVDLEQIIVSGGLRPIEASAYGRAVTVITAEEIEQRQIRYVADALRAAPGVAVSRTGAVGGLTQVRLRGAEGNHTLVLIDGVNVASSNLDEFDFGGLLASDIERIEILRGPQSSLYGANALGGVISITTKSGADGDNIGGEVEVGADGSYLTSAFLRRGGDIGDVSVSVARQFTGGFDVADEPGGQDDEDENLTLNAKGRLFVTDAATIGGSLRYTDRLSDFDSLNFIATTRDGYVTEGDNQAETRELFGSLNATFDSFGGRLEHGPTYDYTLGDRESLTDRVATSDVTGERHVLKYQGTIALDSPQLATAAHSLTLLGSWEQENFDDNLNRNPTQTREVFSAVGEYRGSLFQALDYQIGVRHDVNDPFEDATTYSAAASYSVAATGSRLHGSVGTGVVKPSFFEMFGVIAPTMFFPAGYQGNPGLKPESSFGWDIGVEQSFLEDRLVVDVTYFNQDLKDEITYDDMSTPNTFINQSGSSTRNGVEVSATFEPTDRLTFDAAYTYLDAKNPDGSIEVRRPRHEARFGAGFGFNEGASNIRVDARYVADNFNVDRVTFPSPTIKLENYLLVDLAASHQLTDNFQLFGRVNNVFDADYEEVFGYATDGVNGAIGLRVQY